MRAAIRKMKRMRGIHKRLEAGKQPTPEEQRFYKNQRLWDYWIVSHSVVAKSEFGKKIIERMKEISE